jgi:SMC interacting uncharacterized protein involved in chromosome segregation
VEASEDYEVLQLVNASLLDERTDSRYKCEDLEAKLKKVHSDSTASIAALEAKVKYAKTYNTEVAAASNKRLSDFETELIKDLAGLRKLYVHNVQSIEDLCSLMPGGRSFGCGLHPLAFYGGCWHPRNFWHK